MAKKTNLTIVVSCFLFFTSLSPIQAQGLPEWTSSPLGNACAFTAGDGDKVATLMGIECLFSNFINVAIPLIGLAILVMFVLGAYQLITSGGDPKAVSAGKNTITYAILGLIIAISAWFILNLIAQFTGADQPDGDIREFSTQV